MITIYHRTIIIYLQEAYYQPTFPEFSQQIQNVLDEYDAIFIKTNWSSPVVNYSSLYIVTFAIELVILEKRPFLKILFVRKNKESI